MLKFLLRRFVQFVFTLFCVATIIFFALRVLPGDPVEFKYVNEGGVISAEQLQAQRERFGYDRPLAQQYVSWIGGLTQLDLGTSIWSENPVSEEIGVRFGITIQLAVLALVIGLLFAIPLGVIGALTRGTWIDQVVRVLTVTGQSVPSFWLAMLILMALLLTLGWIPSIEAVQFQQQPWEYIGQIFFPALAVGWRLSSVNARLLRSSLIEVLSQDYVRTAHAKGVAPSRVVWRHALSNALLPTVTVIGIEFAGLLGGLVVTEQVFNINGIGRLLVQAISFNDLTLIQGLVMLFALIYVSVSFVVDLVQALLDPRIRVQ
ncbi:MAG: ABC transporter permease [Hydrogenophaga sp.]|jgi:peptide/nickel transport system permease protein|uniref:ABC transporter permease n=1 Tax=Hydrogenophaga sp. TaxID=1904254 RepID=UPI00271D58A5|nr:ABC transporter permease [Hydrogenophaga sp.]MDO9201566.1 ABC transporter permease [Hydrogenophaga sp.]MDO9481442.1 ABC transporter permease [Hydrogenophaga sp.]MDO9570636.1 ABC transporter permease [Hydrogenophaga sp.]MDP1895429.1 ABC transporter permease [Hydrogenophaga sp.]MDP2095382.1 ABC transporter permease [Hydrogenophaga sp.]